MVTAVVPRFYTLTALLKQLIDRVDGCDWHELALRLQVVFAVQLLVAIENAENMLRINPSTDAEASKKREFDLMIECLSKTDFCHLNLTTQIRYSIDSGTTDGSIPKLYGINPHHVVPKKEFIIQFFGKFKYADRKNYGTTYEPSLEIEGKSFKPTFADPHRLMFEPTLEKAPFKTNHCSQFFAKLIVRYEVGNLGYVRANISTFEFNVPIRALPIEAGILELLGEEKPPVQMGWGEERTFEVFTICQFKFKSFDGKQQKFYVVDLLKEAAACNYKYTKTVPYLMITYVKHSDRDYNSTWRITTSPPVDL